MENSNLIELEKSIIIIQKKLCVKYGSVFLPGFFNLLIGVALQTFNNLELPINGLRHPIQNPNVTNWYIWCGDYSQDDNFFSSIHVNHLLEICPEALNYLGLSPGWRFQFDNNKYEDVWYDESLLLI